MDEIEWKKCTLCGLTKPQSDFHRVASTSGRRRSRCKECSKVRNLSKEAVSNASDGLDFMHDELSPMHEGLSPTHEGLSPMHDAPGCEADEPQ